MNQRTNPAQRTFEPPAADLAVIQRRAFTIGAAGAVVLLVGGVINPEQMFRSYLVACLYWLAIPLGCFGLAMLHHLSGGGWGLMIRRVLEAAARTLPVVALFFLPLLLGFRHLYHWSDPAAVASDPLLQHQSPYLNVPFFVIRSIFYFAVWCTLAWVLTRLSMRQDEMGEPGRTVEAAALGRRMRLLSAPGLGLYCITATFASIDWLMSLDSHWYSSIYGVYFVGGQVVSALAFVILVSLFLAARRPMSDVFRPVHFHDYGKLLLAFVVLWAYFAVSQLIIIWQGNLAEEVGWYRGRLLGGWRWVSLALVLLHFALPFLLLLSRDLKRNVSRLSGVAMLLLVMRWVDLYWLAAPAFHPDHAVLHWLDIVAPVALGGIWIGVFAGQLRGRSLLPINDPDLAEALGHG